MTQDTLTEEERAQADAQPAFHVQIIQVPWRGDSRVNADQSLISLVRRLVINGVPIAVGPYESGLPVPLRALECPFRIIAEAGVFLLIEIPDMSPWSLAKLGIASGFTNLEEVWMEGSTRDNIVLAVATLEVIEDQGETGAADDLLEVLGL